MKIFTSRYQNPELQSGNYTVVGITRGAPRFPLKYKLSGNIIEFAPPGYLFSENDRAVFTPKFFAHLDRVGIERAKSLLRPYLSFNKDIVLCCYEDVRIPDEWCYRLVFAEWWQARTGMAIPELQDSSTCKSGKKPEAQQKQMTLFDLL